MQVFFRGEDEFDQLVRIAKVLGSEELYRYADKYGVEVDPALVQAVGYRPRWVGAVGVCGGVLGWVCWGGVEVCGGGVGECVWVCGWAGAALGVGSAGGERATLVPQLTDPTTPHTHTHRRQPWRKFVNDDNRHLVTPEALDLLTKLLTYDHHARPTAAEAMAHDYFGPLRSGAAPSGSS